MGWEYPACWENNVANTRKYEPYGMGERKGIRSLAPDAHH